MDIIWRNSADPSVYEAAGLRRLFNSRIPHRYPEAIVFAISPEDIIHAVEIATSHGLRVAVRSGGHSWPAWSVRDESILIDLGEYKDIQVDKDRMIARVSSSVTGFELNDKLQDYGLLFGAGHCPDVGLGGFLLQGGMGWNCKNWGWACEQVQAIDVITADGRHLHCNAEEHNDLLWAARGAGPGFPGIITTFHLQLREAPRAMRCSGYMYPKTHFKELFAWILSLAPQYNDSTEITLISFYPPESEDVCLLDSFVSFTNTPEAAREALKRAHNDHPPGTISEWFCREDSLKMEYKSQFKANAPGLRWCTENSYISNDADVASIVKDAFLTLSHRKSYTLWYAMQPNSRRQLLDMAMSLMSDHYLMLYVAWESADDDARCQNWSRDIISQVKPYSVGSYLGDSDFQVRVAPYWGRAQSQRLKEIRRKWDPRGRFCTYLGLEESGERESAGYFLT